MRPVLPLLHRLWAEPRAPEPPPWGPFDHGLHVVALLLLGIEAVTRDELPLTEVFLGLGVLLAVPFRRRAPLAAVTYAFGVVTGLGFAELVSGNRPPEPYTTALMLTVPYALVRWGAGREILAGVPMLLVAITVGLVAEDGGVPELIGSFAIPSAAMGAGLATRFRDRARRQQIREVKAEERAQIARDLHDTVAHHVSGIAIRARAGLAMAAKDPGAAEEALRVVAQEASKTLDEMRAMVGYLRQDEAPELAPQAGLQDIEGLGAGDGPEVAVVVSGPVEDVPSAVSAAVYRLAQEAITNARRHARRAQRIEVDVSIEEEQVKLQVTDDGEAVVRGPMSVGYGLIGMRERAEQLGGRCEAGPGATRGWTVTAVLPKGAS